VTRPYESTKLAEGVCVGLSKASVRGTQAAIVFDQNFMEADQTFVFDPVVWNRGTKKLL
jgi:hypothetical protein